MNQPPVSVLAGWIAPTDKWAKFSDEWRQALSMKPALNYFKMNEAMSLRGEFAGWATETRDQRLKYLVNLIAEHKLIGVATTIPHDLYQEIFVGRTDKKFDVPYFLMFYALMAGITKEFHKYGLSKVSFVFDEQRDQMDKIMGEWLKFRSLAPPAIRSALGEAPIFRNDITTLPLQAADLWAWYLRKAHIAMIQGSTIWPPAPWAPAGGVLNSVGWDWNRVSLQQAFDATVQAKSIGGEVHIWPTDD